MSRNRTFVWNVMITWISWKFPLFYFEFLDILCAWIGNSSQKLWQLDFLESFHCSISSVSISYVPKLDIREKSYEHWNFSRVSIVQFQASRYIMHLNWTSERKVLTNWIFRELLSFNFERLDILSTWIEHPSEKLWPFKFLESFRFSIASVSIYYVPK